MPTVETTSWADQVEAGEEGEIPPPSETLEKGIKKVTEYKRNDDGKLVKIVRSYRMETHRTLKVIAQRKKIPKFGRAAHDGPGPNPSTTAIADDVFLMLTTNREQLEQQEDDPLKKLQGQKMVSCRICKGDHWTTRCPYRDTLGDQQSSKPAEEPQADSGAAAAASIGATSGGKYVPPNQRGAPGGRTPVGSTMSMRGQRDDTATIRVTNLSEDTTETDLQELFKPFGPIARIYLAKDKITQASKGFAFINYRMREDAARAIQNLQGYGYDHLILNVEWAKPSTQN